MKKKKFPIVLPEMTIDGIEDAEKKIEELYALARQLRSAVQHAEKMKINPVIRKLNRRVKRGETLFYVTAFNEDTVASPYYFMQTKYGGLTVWHNEKGKEHITSIDRVYKFNLYGPSELIYDRTAAVDCRKDTPKPQVTKRRKRPQAATRRGVKETRRKGKKSNCSKVA